MVKASGFFAPVQKEVDSNNVTVEFAHKIMSDVKSLSLKAGLMNMRVPSPDNDKAAQIIDSCHEKLTQTIDAPQISTEESSEQKFRL